MNYEKGQKCSTFQTTKKVLLKTMFTLILLTWRIWWAPNNASRWQMVFNVAFKEL